MTKPVPVRLMHYGIKLLCTSASHNILSQLLLHWEKLACICPCPLMQSLMHRYMPMTQYRVSCMPYCMQSEGDEGMLVDLAIEGLEMLAAVKRFTAASISQQTGRLRTGALELRRLPNPKERRPS